MILLKLILYNKLCAENDSMQKVYQEKLLFIAHTLLTYFRQILYTISKELFFSKKFDGVSPKFNLEALPN
jgi:hypothetical protein